MKVLIDIPDIPKNDKQRWAIANGTPYEERPHGEWRITFDGCECSICKDTTLSIPMNFCPNCGASMRKEGEAE